MNIEFNMAVATDGGFAGRDAVRVSLPLPTLPLPLLSGTADRGRGEQVVGG